MSNTIAVYNFKGGVGKTSTVFNLALNWSRAFRVLVIDCDPQANLTYALMSKPSKPTILDHVTRQLHNSLPEISPEEITPYFHLIPGDYGMVKMESNSQYISFGQDIAQKIISSVKPRYDFILLDFPTHFGITVKSFLINIDRILIPVIPDSFSVSGVKKLLSHLTEIKKDKPFNILGVFFNQFKKISLHHKKIITKAETELGSLVLNQKIRQSVKVSETINLRRLIPDPEEEVPAVLLDFEQLSEELIERLNAFYLDEIAFAHK